MLLTAQREIEVAGMRWSEIHDDDVWEIPGSRSKNGKPHTVHLSALALEILEAVPKIKSQDLLFSGNGKTPVSGFSSGKTRLDRHMLRALQEVHEDAQLSPWVLHDLRRTATTGMARLGIAPHVADRVLNHQAGTIRGVAAVYNRFEYIDERKAALDAWGRFVEGLIGREPQNVVPIRRAEL
jgi:integrase